MLKFLETLLKCIEFIFVVAETCYKHLFELLDTVALIFTYLSTLYLTYYMVSSCAKGSYLTTIACAVCIFTLSHVNQRLRGGN